MDTSFLSLLPIIVTIALAILTKNVIVSLFLGTLTGGFILFGCNPFTTIQSTFSTYLLPQFLSEYNSGILILLAFIGGFVTLVEKSGGAEAFARSVSNFVNTRCKTQLAAWLGGMLIFFSDLGTPLIVGPVFSDIFKKMRVSKEKLAWIIDSTASPICCMIPFIGWGVAAMSCVQDSFDSLSITNMSDWTAICRAIPFQIYPILCIVIVPLVALWGREIGPMAKCEQQALEGIFSKNDGQEMDSKYNMIINNNASPLIVVIPLVVLFSVFFGLLIPQGFPFEEMTGNQIRFALMTGYFLAAVVLILLMAHYKVASIKDSTKIYIDGLSSLFDCMALLILAWALNAIGTELGTANYIVQITNGNVPVWAIPALIFIAGSIVSFATGTSWGTFAIVIPIAIQMAFVIGSPIELAIGATIAGGLFGDHCSPVSDTTILASIGSGCKLLSHTYTQLPYALLCAVVSLIGFIVAGFTGSVISSAISIVILIAAYPVCAHFFGTKIPNLSAADVARMDQNNQ